jgi:hypothetical protein
LPQDNLPEITEGMRQGALTVFAYDQNNRIKLGERRLALIHNQIDQGTGSLRLKAVIPAAASASVSRREMPFSSVCNPPESAASKAAMDDVPMTSSSARCSTFYLANPDYGVGVATRMGLSSDDLPPAIAAE